MTEDAPARRIAAEPAASPPVPASSPTDPLTTAATASNARLPESYGGLRALQAEFRRYQEAAFPIRPPQFFALELAGETGELANLEKKAWKGRRVDSADLADEAADVCIALLNFANSRRIDLAAAVEAKMRRVDQRQRSDPEPACPEEGS